MSVHSAQEALLRHAFRLAIDAASPGQLVRASSLLARLRRDPPTGRAVIFALGKGAIGMAEALVAEWPLVEPPTGLVIAPHGHDEPSLPFRVVHGSHPRADKHSAEAARRALDLMATLQPDDRLLVLLSGGGSALATLPVAGVSIRELATLINALMRMGADIAELNTVRKHLGQIGGGKLALASNAGSIDILALSDVPDDDIGLIASGPFSPDPTTLEDARLILARHDVAIPPTIADALSDPANETPKPGLACFGAIDTETIPASIWIDPVHAMLEAEGYAVTVLARQLDGDAHDIALSHALAAIAAAERGERRAIISGGEATVTVRGDGYGGPSAETALCFAALVQTCEHVHALFADTDGIDGPTRNAGAVVGPLTIKRIDRLGLCARTALSNSDSATIFDALGDAVVTGSTGTNVNDFRLVLVN